MAAIGVYCTDSSLKLLAASLDSSVHEKLVKGGEEGLTEACLRRWLVARKGNVDEAARDLAAHAEWRVQFTPQGRVQEHEVAGQLCEEKVFVQGYDIGHKPFLVVKVKNHVAGNTEQSLRYVVYCLDQLVSMNEAEKNPSGKYVGIFDFEGLTYKNLDFPVLKGIFVLLQSHYPERLHKIYMYRASALFMTLWKLVYPFIDPVTREKVQFVTAEEGLEVFSRAFSNKYLPPEYGGLSRWIPAGEARAQFPPSPSEDSSKRLQEDGLLGLEEEEGGRRALVMTQA